MKLLLRYPLVLGSKSPRRMELLKSLGIDFSVNSIDLDESFPVTMEPAEAAVYLAEKKARTLSANYADEVLLTADTIVAHDGILYGKPEDRSAAVQMLNQLSGRQHEVITGICLGQSGHFITAYDTTTVFFRNMEPKEIEYYVNHFRPFDKAGGYGIQEWIGMVAIERIEGSYFNVMGLPIAKVYSLLREYDFLYFRDEDGY